MLFISLGILKMTPPKTGGKKKRGNGAMFPKGF